MIQGKWFAPGETLPDSILSVRRAVFGRGADSLDALSWNAVIFSDDVPCAAGRIWWEDGAFWLGDICVLAPYRGRRIGDLALRLLLFKAQDHSAREVRLRAPESVTGFFARLGLRPVSRDGDSVEMMIPGDQIDLDTCKGCPKTNCPGRK